MKLMREICEADEVEGTEAEELLANLAEGFLRAGGSLSLDEWAVLEDCERVALMFAGDRIRAEQAVMTAQSLNPEYAALVSQPYDDGQALCDWAVKQAAQAEACRGQESYL